MGGGRETLILRRDLGNSPGTEGIVPFVNRTFEWGVFIATFLSVLSIVPRHYARLIYFLHPKLRKLNVVPITLKLTILTLWRLRCAGTVPGGVPVSAMPVSCVRSKVGGSGENLCAP